MSDATDPTVECNKLVLVVEDDRDVRDTLVEVLEDNGYRPLAAGNGREALDQLHESTEKPCLILLDVMMPVMDGWQFRSAQKDDPPLRSIPVIVLTAHASAQQAAQEMEAAGYLKKPVSLQALLQTVAKFCG